MKGKVSVIITTYNRDYNTLKRAINSVFTQTYSNFEIIVVNDTPAEFPYFSEVSKGIEEYKEKLTYIANGVNRGACFIRNQGFEVSNGEYVAFLDDDDEWLQNKLEEQVKLISSKKCVMVSSAYNCIWLDTFNQPIKEKIKNNKKYKIKTEEILHKNIIGGCSAPLISHEAFKLSGGFNNSLPAAQDADLWIRISKLGDIYCVLTPLLNYYIYASERISNNPEKKIFATKHLIAQYANMAENKPLFLKEKYMLIAFNYYLLTNKKEGDKFYNLAQQQKGISKTFMIYWLRSLKRRAIK